MNSIPDRLIAALSDRYTIERELGAGGMATVYLAEDIKHHRKVAIKVLHAELSAILGPERFLKEIELTASLQHPHILPLFDSGSADGLLYYVMPYVEGETLRGRLNRDKQLSIADAVRIASEAADALEYAHRRGVVHRDIKPENILLHDGHALVADFGIALAVEQAGGTRMTQTGLSLGTPQYMSPEQAMGERNIDARTDIYALGAVTYEMLAGEPPFSGPTAQAIVAKVMTEDPRSLTAQRRSVPEYVDAAVETALQKLPADRFASAAAFGAALSGTGEQVRSHSRPRGANRRRYMFAMIAAASAVLVALCAAAFLAGSHRRADAAQVVYHAVTFENQVIFTARFAADGRTIVFDAARQANVPAVYVIRPDYPEARPLGLEDTHLLAASSHGDLAVLTRAHYISHRVFVGTLARVPLEGGTPREMLDSVRDADWSPDGSALAIIHEVGGRDRLEYPIGTVLYDAAGYLSDLRISPDGERVAFMEHPARYDDRGTVDVVDRTRRRTVIAQGFSGEQGVAWSLDGRSVLFSSGEGLGYQVREATLDGVSSQRLATPEAMIIQDVSRGGSWLASSYAESRIARVRAPGTTGEADVSWLDASVAAALSHDGRLVALADVSTVAGTNYASVLRRTDGSPAVRLGEGWPAGFTRDGQWVISMVPTTPAQLRLYPVGTGETRRVDLGAFLTIDAAEVWGPREDSILACGTMAAHTRSCYFRTTADQKWRAVSAPLTSVEVSPSFVSPDGHQFLGRDAAGANIVYDLRTDSVRPLRGLLAGDDVIRWSPDGKSLWVWRADTLPIIIDRIDVATGQRTLLETLVPPGDQGLRHIVAVTLADDPRVYAYGAGRVISQLFVVEGARHR
jgi:hypothetical protein